MRKKLFILVILIMILLSFYISYTITIKDLPTNIMFYLKKNYQEEKSTFYKIDFLSIIKNNYKQGSFLINKNLDIKDTLEVDKVLYNDTPLIYIYNTHANEEYSYSKNDIYNIVPTVMTASNILENELKKYGIESIVEKNNTTSIVNNRGLPFSSSYKVSRELLEDANNNNPSLKYFIDLHRDSVERKVTTIEINGISYAKIMFLLGLENPNYEENKEVMQSLNNYLEENYKGLSRGIYEKKGKGVNGVYNQDYNKFVMLIEVGGVDNTIDEVYNSLKIISECLNNYIESNKSTKIE